MIAVTFGLPVLTSVALSAEALWQNIVGLTVSAAFFGIFPPGLLQVSMLSFLVH